MGETPAESRTIVFTDSRDDAARTAAGVGLNHYRDVIRQVTQQILAEGPVDIGELVDQGCVGMEPLDAAEQLAFEDFKERLPRSGSAVGEGRLRAARLRASRPSSTKR